MQNKLPEIENIGIIVPRQLEAEMQESYLDYAMSVIISRALPDVRDGLKPVHRRILYAMWELGLRHNAKYRKSAHVVGSVMAKYHPHGDSAIYDSMVRMAQEFSYRHTLVDGQGNFGSMDGDSAAAMRYTEARLDRIAEEMLFDIEKNTVRWQPTYDGSHKEPTVLPAKLPNLLLNGSMGIAVGMATNIPPHNLGELIDAIIHLISNPDATVEDLMQFVLGPDFPTGGIIYDKAAITQAYSTGRGSIPVRAKTEIGEVKGGTPAIIITEVPYAVNKAELLSHIAELVRDKKLEGIRDLRDESNKDGVRVVVELKRDAYPKKVLNALFAKTVLQTAFHVNMLALVDGIQPRVLTLKNILEEYVKHRQAVIRARAEFDLAKAKERAHILEGLKIAILHIDEIIATIKKSQDKDEAKINLIKKFKLTDPQSIAILEMRLQQLANLERIRVETELADKYGVIKELEALLASPKRILQVVKDETLELKETHANPRRSKIVASGIKDFSMEDLVPDEPTIAIITHDGYIKRLPPETFRTQARGGKGVMGLTTKEEDVVEHLLSTTTHSDLLFFTSRGRVFQLKAYEIPVASRIAKGQALVNFLQLSGEERVSVVIPLEEVSDAKFLVMVTEKGLIKKVAIADFKNVRRSGLIAIKLNDGDNLKWVKPSGGKDEVILITEMGQSIRFKESDFRGMGRVAAGVKGIRLKGKDAIVGMDILDPELIKKGMLELFIVTKMGFGKRTNLKQYKVQHRGGSGIKTAQLSAKTGTIVKAYVANSQEEADIIVVSRNGQVIRLPFKSVSVLGRATQGVRLMRFKEDKDTVASVTFV